LAKKNEIPFVYYWIDVLHTLIPSGVFQSYGRYLEKIALKNSLYVITINDKLADYVQHMGVEKEKICIIRAGVDLERFNPEIDGSNIREAYEIKKDDTVLFFMGWLYHFSGLKEVALELTKSNDNNIKLLVVGDGDALDDLQKIKEKYNLDGQLILTDKQPYEKIPEFISAADICLLPAYPDEEVMQNIVPIKMYEYMAMGKPVITTKFPGVMKEFGRNGGVIYIDRPEDAMEKTIELIETKSFKDRGSKARKFAKKYDWNTITDEFGRILEGIVHG
jgi:glycosyltransferase involved in cell wall biosynthesis